jgi:transposase
MMTSAAVGLWKRSANADPAWIKGIEVVATDLPQSCRAGLSPHIDHAIRVAEPFHVVRVANRCLDAVRRRVQYETLGHRGRKDDLLYKIRKLLLTASERLDEHECVQMLLSLRTGDPHNEVVAREGRRSRRRSGWQLRRRSRRVGQSHRGPTTLKGSDRLATRVRRGEPRS